MVNRAPNQDRPEGFTYSVGIHPWDADAADISLWDKLEKAAGEKNVMAIGEAGLDLMRGPSIEIQTECFKRHIELSEAVGKPLVIHCVRAFHRLLKLIKEMSPKQPWIVHGFRGKPELAHQLIDAGMWISLGPKFNDLTAEIIPAERLLIETDDACNITIEEVAALVARARHSSATTLLKPNPLWLDE